MSLLKKAKKIAKRADKENVKFSEESDSNCSWRESADKVKKRRDPYPNIKYKSKKI